MGSIVLRCYDFVLIHCNLFVVVHLMTTALGL